MNKSSLRIRADRVKTLRCKNLIAVIEYPKDIRNIGSVIRNVNALGAEKVYIVTDNADLTLEWQAMRDRHSLMSVSASAVRWTFVRVFPDTESCLAHLERKGFVSIVTSPHTHGKQNVGLPDGDYTRYKKLAVWFGNESRGISDLALERSVLCVQIPMSGIIESLNLGSSSGIILYEIIKQRRAYQNSLVANPPVRQRRKLDVWQDRA
jgi:tRNA (guanosine-2'-O-)-methyltransferase